MIHNPNINAADPEESIAVFEQLSHQLIAQNNLATQRFNFLKVLFQTNQPSDDIARQRDGVWEAWYRLEALEKALQPWWDRGFPKVSYSRPNFYEEVKRLEEQNSWAPWQRDAGLHADSADDLAGTDFDKYRAAKEKLVNAAKQAKTSYGNFRVVVETDQDPALIAELQLAGLRGKFELEMCEQEIAPFIERGYPPVLFERPPFEAPIQTQPDLWNGWAKEINLASRISNDDPTRKNWVK